MTTPSIKADAKSIFLLCGALLVVLLGKYGCVIFGGANFYLADSSLYFEPLCRFIGDAFSHGRLPLWNPFSYCGMPQIAIPSPGLFNPFTLLFAIFPFSTAIALQLIAHQLICGVGMFLLLRFAGKERSAAAIGATVAALSGYMFTLHTNYTLVLTAAWVPLACFFTLRLRARRSQAQALNFIGAAVSVAMMLLSGRPEIFTTALVIMTIALTMLAGAQKHWKALLWRMGAKTVGTAMAAPMLLPLLEWIALSPRGHGLPKSEIFTWSGNWYDFLGLMLPQPLGDLSGSGSDFLGMVTSHPGFVPFAASSYIGIVPIVLAVYAICSMQKRQRIASAIIIFILSILVLGANSFIGPMLMHIPGLALLRYPIKLMCLLIFVLAFLCGSGAEALIKRTTSTIADRIAAGITAVCAVVGLAFVAMPDQLCSVFYGSTHQSFSFGIDLIGEHLLVAAILGGVFLSLTRSFQNSNGTQTGRYATMLGALVAIPLAAAAIYSASHTTDANFYRQNSEVAVKLKRLSPHPGRTLATYLVLRSAPSTYKYSTDAIASFHAYHRDMLVPNTHMDYDLPSSYGYESAETLAYRDFFLAGTQLFDTAQIVAGGRVSPAPVKDKELAFARFCQMTGTEFVLTLDKVASGQGVADFPALNAKYFSLVETDGFRNLRIYKTIKPRSRVYFADRCRPGSALDALQADDSNICFVAGSDVTGQSFDTTSSACRVVSETSDRLECTTESANAQLLVSTDQNYPGWKAFVDERETPILTVNGLQRAVPLSAGPHRVRFEYKPLKLTVGFALLALGVMALAALLKLDWQLREPEPT